MLHDALKLMYIVCCYVTLKQCISSYKKAYFALVCTNTKIKFILFNLIYLLFDLFRKKTLRYILNVNRLTINIQIKLNVYLRIPNKLDRCNR